MTYVITASEARSTWADVIERVLAGEVVHITRHGEEVAIMARPDVFHTRRAGRAQTVADDLARRRALARTAPLATEGGLSIERAEELVAEIRAGRDAR